MQRIVEISDYFEGTEVLRINVIIWSRHLQDKLRSFLPIGSFLTYRDVISGESQTSEI